jgi:hypothetical protein
VVNDSVLLARTVMAALEWDKWSNQAAFFFRSAQRFIASPIFRLAIADSSRSR